MRIGVDIDDTVTDTVEYMYTEFIYWYQYIANLGHYEGVYNPANYDLCEKFTKVSEQQIDKFSTWYYNNSKQNAPLREGVVEMFHRLRNEGDEIHIITRRGTKNLKKHDESKVKTETLLYLQRKGVEYDKIHFNGIDKEKVLEKGNISCLVDDFAPNILRVSSAGKVAIIVDNPWNKNLVGVRNTCRIKCFDEAFYDIIQQIKQLEEKIK